MIALFQQQHRCRSIYIFFYLLFFFFLQILGVEGMRFVWSRSIACCKNVVVFFFFFKEKGWEGGRGEGDGVQIRQFCMADCFVWQMSSKTFLCSFVYFFG